MSKILVEREIMERMSKLWPEDMEDDGSGRVGFIPEVRNTVKSFRKELRNNTAVFEEPRVKASSVAEALNDLEFTLMFARCNMDHAGTRRDVGKAIAQLNRLRELLIEEESK